MIKIKSEKEIEVMQIGGKIAAKALNTALDAVAPGITTFELDMVAEEIILENGAEPSFKTVEGYNYSTCVNLNKGLVHGVPNEYKTCTGDLLSIDLGTLYKGFHTDVAFTIEVGSGEEEKFLAIGEKALNAGIDQCFPGKRLGDISNAIQTVIEKMGYTISRDLVGHGIGKGLHEEPQIPGYGKNGKGLQLKSGMVFAIEVIYQKGDPTIALASDEWTIETADSSLGALFEHTVAVTSKGPRILTSL